MKCEHEYRQLENAQRLVNLQYDAHFYCVKCLDIRHRTSAENGKEDE